MKRPRIAVVSVVLSLALVSTSASAQEIRVPTPMTWMRPDASSELRYQLTVARFRAENALPNRVAPPLQETRLSSGAKTAIIVGAIVVGVLILVGAIALSRPGKHLP
jgi:hypothetical protein